MGVRWQQQLGNTSRFAVLLRLEDDPDEGAGATREMAASWGSFELWVRGQNICLHDEQGETLTAVHWYLLPLLEWLAENWVPLLHEEKLPMQNAGTDGWSGLERTAFPPAAADDEAAQEWDATWAQWRKRHSLEAAREGGLFPDVVFRRFRDEIEVSWGAARIAGAPDDFRFAHSRGVERLHPAEVARPLFGVALSTAECLLEEIPRSQRLKRLVRQLKLLEQTPADEHLAWMVGLGRAASRIRTAWTKLKESLSKLPNAAAALWPEQSSGLVAEGSCQVALMFGAASPTLAETDILSLARRGISDFIPAGLTESVALRKLVRDEPAPLDNEAATEDGYRLAQEVLEKLGIDVETVSKVDVEKILETLRVSRDSIDLEDRSIRAVSIAGPRHRPSVLVNSRCAFNKNAGAFRFTLAHELCHILFDRTAGRELALISGPWAPLAVERRANAFAAMLLMPPPVVQRAMARLTVAEDTGEGIRALAQQLGTSVSATLEHIGNLKKWDESTRERVRSDVADSKP